MSTNIKRDWFAILVVAIEIVIIVIAGGVVYAVVHNEGY